MLILVIELEVIEIEFTPWSYRMLIMGIELKAISWGILNRFSNWGLFAFGATNGLIAVAVFNLLSIATGSPNG